MNQSYFIVEFAHSIHGQFKRVHLTPKVLKYALASLILVAALVAGLFSTCLWMGWKMSRYQRMEAELDQMRGRYRDLQRLNSQSGQQMASLESLASEVSAAYGLQPQQADPEVDNPDVSPTVRESIQEFNFLKAASYSGLYHRYAYQWQQHSQPSGWPVIGILRSSFGERSDPFSGEGAFHTGIDLSASSGTPVKATADGVVASAGWSGRYGKLVVIDHGAGVQTYYAHLSQTLVVPGEDVRAGQEVALSGGTGRVTSPHLHYEVRVAGTPVNPYRYLVRPEVVAQAAHRAHDDLGL